MSRRETTVHCNSVLYWVRTPSMTATNIPTCFQRQMTEEAPLAAAEDVHSQPLFHLFFNVCIRGGAVQVHNAPENNTT